MSQYVLIAKGMTVLQCTIQLLTTEELYNDDEINERKNFNKIVQVKFSNYLQFPDDNVEKFGIEDFIDVDEEIINKLFWINGDPVSDEKAQYEQPATDLLVRLELNMLQVDEM